MGGAASASACCLALVDNCESDACRNFIIEKRRDCFGVASCTGGDTGRSSGSVSSGEENAMAGADDCGVSSSESDARASLRGSCSLSLPARLSAAEAAPGGPGTSSE